MNEETKPEKTQKARQRQTNKVLKTEDILHSKDKQYGLCDWLKLKDKKRKEREASLKKYKPVLQKCDKNTKTYISSDTDRSLQFTKS